MFIKFIDLDDFIQEITEHRNEVEPGMATVPVIRVQEYVTSQNRQASILMRYHIEIAAKRRHGSDILLYNELVGQVDHWGKEFPSEERRRDLVLKTDERISQIRERLAHLEFDLRRGRWIEAG